MKQTLNFFNRFMVLLVAMLTLGVTQVWGADPVYTGTFKSKSWAISNTGDYKAEFVSDKDAYQYSNPNVQITAAYSGAGATSKTSYTNITKITISASTTSKGVGNITVKVGDGAAQTICSLSKNSTATYYNLEYSTPVSGKVTFVVNCSINSMYVQEIQITTAAKSVSEIAVKTPPTKVKYVAGEMFDPAGLVITATYDDESTEDITYSDATKDDFTFSPNLTTALQATDSKVTITYAKKSADQNISVSAPTGKAVTVTANPAEGGKPSANPSNNIAQGTEVTLSANPEPGYTFTSWYAIDADAQEITVTDNKFNMPASDVEVEATFTPIAVTEVQLKASTSIEVGSSETLTATVLPSDALVQTLTWASDDPNVATVDQTGKVTAVKAGSTTITATSNNNKVGTCAVTVTPALPTITITDAQVSSFTTKYKDYTWTASNISGHLFAYKSNGMQFNTNQSGYYIYNTDAIPGNIRRITMTTHNSGTERNWTAWVSPSPITEEEGEETELESKQIAKSGTTWTVTGNNQYFFLQDDNGASNISSVVIAYEPIVSAVTLAPCEHGSVGVTGAADLTKVTAGTELTLSNNPSEGYLLNEYSVVKTGEPATTVTITDGKFTMPAYAVTVSATFKEGVTAPTLSLAAGSYWGAQNVKVSNYTDTYNYYYTLDGTTPDDTKTAYVDADGINVAATCTLKVIAYKNTSTSEVTSAAYTIKPKFNSLQELAAADLTSGTEVQVTFSNQPIKDFYTYSGAKRGVYFDIQKGGYDIEIFGPSAVPSTWQAGGKLSGTMTCPWKKYSNTWELAPTTGWEWSSLTYTAPATIDHITVSGTPNQTSYVAGAKFNPAGLTVTAYYTDETHEEVTSGITWACTPERVDAGTTTVSVTATYNDKTSDAYNVTGLTTTDIPSSTIAAFKTAQGGRCYLTGVVSDIATSGSSTGKKCTFTDASGSIVLYGILTSAREATTFSALDVVNGDKIKIIAEEYDKYYSTDQVIDAEFVAEIVLSSIAITGTPKTSYAIGEDFDFTGLTATGTYTDATHSDLTSKVTWAADPATIAATTESVSVTATLGSIVSTAQEYNITITKKTPTITIADMTLGLGDTNVPIVATTVPEDAALTYTITEGSEFITLSEGKVSAVAAGTATIKASFAGDEEYQAADKTFTVTVLNIKQAVKDGFTTGDNTGSHGFDNTSNITFRAEKGNAGTAPALNNGNLRIYQDGGYIVLAAAKGCKIAEVKISTSSTYSTTVGYSFTETALATSGTAVAASSTDLSIVSGIEKDTVVLICLGTSKTTRLELSGIKVIYTGSPIAVDHIAVSGTHPTEFECYSAFHHNGAVVTAVYTDLSEADVTAASTFSTPEDMDVPGQKTITVSYQTFQTSYTITVKEPVLDAIELAGAPQTTFHIGDSFTSDGLLVIATFNGSHEEYVTDDATITAPDMTTSGTKDVNVSYTYGSVTKEASYTISVIPASAIFYESFNDNDGTGGNDDKWSGSIASSTWYADNEGWTGNSANGANKCAKFGANGSTGSATTPTISATGDMVITFKAGSWKDDGTVLTLATTSGILSQSEITLPNAEWGEFTVTLTNVTSAFTISFTAQANKKRFFLDEVMVQQAYIRNLTSQNIGTVCLDKAANIEDFAGATFFEILSRDADSKNVTLQAVEGTTLTAGQPYIFQPNGATQLILPVYGDAATEAGHSNGLYGWLSDDFTFDSQIDSKDVYFVNDGKIRRCGNNCTIVKNRAYSVLDEIDSDQTAPAPTRRTLTLGVESPLTPTGLDLVGETKLGEPLKFIRHNQLVIIRNGQMYNAAGQLIQ